MYLLKHIFIFLWVLAMATKTLWAQPDTTALVASKQVYAKDSLPFKKYMAMVAQMHPVLRQAQLIQQQGARQVQLARGAFDPKVMANNQQKTYKGKQYYNYSDYQLKIPTWIAADLKAGFETNSGTNVNAENTLPEDGLFYAGIEIPVGRGLFIDERRAALRQAQAYAQLTEAEQLALTNKVLFSAAKAYWYWAFAHKALQQNFFGLELAQNRFDFVSQTVKFGDLAPIDSVEALIEVQKREIQVQQAMVNYYNATLEASNFFWTENFTPLIIDTTTVPVFPEEHQQTEMTEINNLVNTALNQNPYLLKIRAKNASLLIEQRLAREWLKPDVRLSATLLQDNPLTTENLQTNYIGNNYKLGFDVYFPLLLRKERGKLNLTKAKVEAVNLELINLEREVENNTRKALNNNQNYYAQIGKQQQLVNNFTILRDAEQQLFEIGESSQFKLNDRERKLLEERIKFFKIKASFYITRAEIDFYTGQLLPTEFTE